VEYLGASILDTYASGAPISATGGNKVGRWTTDRSAEEKNPNDGRPNNISETKYRYLGLKKMNY